VERRNQVIGQVHSSKPIESGAEPSARVRPFEGEAEGKEEKADASNEDRCNDAFRKYRQLPLIAAKERRRDKKQIDREIRNDHQGHKGDEPFPAEIECPDVVTLRRNPIAPAVDNQEENGESGRCTQSPYGKSSAPSSDVIRLQFVSQHQHRLRVPLEIPNPRFQIPGKRSKLKTKSDS